MKKYLIVVLLSIGSWARGQETATKNSLEFQSIAFHVPLFSVYGANGTGGLKIGADVTGSYGTHLISIMASAGSEFVILGSSDSYSEVNLLYGRELALSRTVFAELHAGAGYFNFRSVDVDPLVFGQETAQTIGFPILGKLRVHTGPSFSIGLLVGVNINSAATLWHAGFTLQWNKRKNKM